MLYIFTLYWWFPSSFRNQPHDFFWKAIHIKLIMYIILKCIFNGNLEFKWKNAVSYNPSKWWCNASIETDKVWQFSSVIKIKTFRNANDIYRSFITDFLWKSLVLISVKRWIFQCKVITGFKNPIYLCI